MTWINVKKVLAGVPMVVAYMLCDRSTLLLASHLLYPSTTELHGYRLTHRQGLGAKDATNPLLVIYKLIDCQQPS